MDFEADVRSIAEAAREYYIERFLRQLSRLEQDGCSLLTESCREDQIDLELPGLDGLPERVDVVVTAPASQRRAIVLNSKGRLDFDEVTGAFDGGAELLIYPFAWEACPLVFETSRGGAINYRELREWFRSWFLPAPDQSAGGRLLEVIHGVTGVTQVNSAVGCVIDFGSAPADAFIDLLRMIVGWDANLTAVIGELPDEG